MFHNNQNGAQRIGGFEFAREQSIVNLVHHKHCQLLHNHPPKVFFAHPPRMIAIPWPPTTFAVMSHKQKVFSREINQSVIRELQCAQALKEMLVRQLRNRLGGSIATVAL